MHRYIHFTLQQPPTYKIQIHLLRCFCLSSKILFTFLSIISFLSSSLNLGRDSSSSFRFSPGVAFQSKNSDGEERLSQMSMQVCAYLREISHYSGRRSNRLTCSSLWVTSRLVVLSPASTLCSWSIMIPLLYGVLFGWNARGVYAQGQVPVE